jgi:dTDP-glucose 4,6-dehydratase
MRTVLITGAAGFLGQHLARAFAAAAQPWRIVLTDQAELPPPPQAGNSIGVRAALSDGPAIAEILREHKVSHVIHAAAHTLDIESAGDLLEQNVVPALTLLEACKSHWTTHANIPGHFHFVSCADVLQANESGVVTDDAAVAPDSLFAATKGAIESFVLGYAARHRFHATLSYPTHFYGPGQPTHEMVPDIIEALLQGRRVPLFGDGKAMIDLVHGEDAALAIRAIVQSSAPGRRYGIRGTSASYAEILATLCRCVDQRASATPDFAKCFDKSPASSGKPTASLITRVQDRRTHIRPRKYLFGAISELVEDYYPRSLYDGLLSCVTSRLAQPGASIVQNNQAKSAVA